MSCQLLAWPGGRRHRWPRPSSHAYFSNLSAAHLPADKNDETIITWYLNWPGRTQNLEAIHHSVPGVHSARFDGVNLAPQPGHCPPPFSGPQWLAHWFWCMAALASTFIASLRGHWWSALILNQAAQAAVVRQTPDQHIAREYLFHNSVYVYRPLWTYEAQRRGAHIIFYFYSTNCERLKFGLEYPTDNIGWAAMSWPRYLVWDQTQAHFVRRNVGPMPSVEIVGPIDFTGKLVDLPPIDGPAFAVFDITPFRESFYRSLGVDGGYYRAADGVQFLEDIVSVAEELGTKLLWKRKRDIGKMAHPVYRAAIQRLELNPIVVPVPVEASARQVIEHCCAVISMPYSSPAATAKTIPRPTVYYDVPGLIDPTDRAAKGVEVLSGQDNLRAWMRQHMSREHAV